MRFRSSISTLVFFTSSSRSSIVASSRAEHSEIFASTNKLSKVDLRLARIVGGVGKKSNRRSVRISSVLYSGGNLTEVRGEFPAVLIYKRLILICSSVILPIQSNIIMSNNIFCCARTGDFEGGTVLWPNRRRSHGLTSNARIYARRPQAVTCKAGKRDPARELRALFHSYRREATGFAKEARTDRQHTVGTATTNASRPESRNKSISSSTR